MFSHTDHTTYKRQTSEHEIILLNMKVYKVKDGLLVSNKPKREKEMLV